MMKAEQRVFLPDTRGRAVKRMIGFRILSWFLFLEEEIILCIQSDPEGLEGDSFSHFYWENQFFIGLFCGGK
jgi:hypothetical protein